MPRYTVHDDASARKISFDWSGAEPPTPEDIAEIIAEANRGPAREQGDPIGPGGGIPRDLTTPEGGVASGKAALATPGIIGTLVSPFVVGGPVAGAALGAGEALVRGGGAGDVARDSLIGALGMKHIPRGAVGKLIEAAKFFKRAKQAAPVAREGLSAAEAAVKYAPRVSQASSTAGPVSIRAAETAVKYAPKAERAAEAAAPAASKAETAVEALAHKPGWGKGAGSAAPKGGPKPQEWVAPDADALKDQVRALGAQGLSKRQITSVLREQHRIPEGPGRQMVEMILGGS